MSATVLVFGSVALSVGYIDERFSQSPRVQRIMNYMAGNVLAGLAIKLAFTKKLSNVA